MSPLLSRLRYRATADTDPAVRADAWEAAEVIEQLADALDKILTAEGRGPGAWGDQIETARVAGQCALARVRGEEA